MKFFTALTLLGASLVSASPMPDNEGKSNALEKRAGPTPGLDIDYTTGSGMPWSSLAGSYYFAYIQSTYGMTVTNSLWSSQKSGARSYRFFTGGVHHPNPAVATPTDQAKFFTANGGGWVADQRTFRGALYLGANKHNTTIPYCYGLTSTAWISWIKEFIGAYNSMNAGHYPVLLTSYDWWKQCTLAYTGFGSVTDIWYFGPTIPTGWTAWKFQQLATSPSPLWRVDSFVGDYTALTAYTA